MNACNTKMILLIALAHIFHVTHTKILCNTNGNSSVSLKIPSVKTTYPESIELKAQVFNGPSNIKVNVLSRQVYVDLRLHEAGITTELHGIVDKAPDFEESRKWLERNECMIGETCNINGDCWGSDAQKCRDTSTNRWVKYSNDILETFWTMSLYRTCTKLWDCKITSQMVNTFIGDEGDMFIWIDGPIKVLKPENGFFHIIGKRSFVVEEPLKVEKEEITLKCFDNKGNLFCKGTKKDGSYIMNVFSAGQRCNTYLRDTVCLHDVTQSPLHDGNRKVVLSDSQTMNFLNVKNLILVETTRLFENDYHIEMATAKNSEILAQLITELSSDHPFLVARLSNGNFHTRQIIGERKMSIDMCERKSLNECKTDYLVTGEAHIDKRCTFHDDDVGTMEIDLFGNSNINLDYPINFDYNLETKDTWISNAEERESRESSELHDLNENSSHVSHWSDFLSISPIVAWLSTNLTYLNTICIIVILFKK